MITGSDMGRLRRKLNKNKKKSGQYEGKLDQTAGVLGEVSSTPQLLWWRVGGSLWTQRGKQSQTETLTSVPQLYPAAWTLTCAVYLCSTARRKFDGLLPTGRRVGY